MYRPHPDDHLNGAGANIYSANTLYTVARLTPNALAIVLAGSPLACIRRANSDLELSSAFGRPMDCPRARRASTRRCAALTA
jgi:hypothetical protein